MKDLDWSEAPYGATHYDLNAVRHPWCKIINIYVYRYDGDNKCWGYIDTYDDNNGKYLIPKPENIQKEPLQKGSTQDPSPEGNSWYDYEKEVAVGFPPIGTDCMVSFYGKWYKTYIIGMDRDNCCVFYCGDFNEDLLYNSYGNGGHINFKPLPTEEELDRENFISDTVEELQSLEKSTRKDIAKWIYENGYRKEEK